MAEDDKPSRESLAHLAERLDRLERALAEGAERLREVERRLRPEEPPTTTTTTPARRPLYESVRDERDEWDEWEPSRGAAASSSASSSSSSPVTPPVTPVTPPTTTVPRGAPGGRPPPPAARKPAPRRDIESIVGGSWFSWVGIIAITFGVAFFLKLVFESGLVGPTARVLLGAAAGVAFLFAGERLRARGLRQYAYVLSGGGVLILYLSAYASYAFYGLVGQAPAFLLMAAVTATAVLLSVRLDAPAIAVLGLIGGFLTPLLLSTGADKQVALFTYIALLDAGVLALAYFKRWRSLNYVSFALTALMIFGWLLEHYSKAKLRPTLFFLTLFFLLYAAIAVVHNVLRRHGARWFDISLVSANATFYFGLSYALLDDAGHRRWLGALALALAAFYAALHYGARRRHGEDRLLVYSYLGVAVTFLTAAIAIQFEQHAVTIGWAIEGLALTLIGLRTGTKAARLAALTVFLAAVLHWAGWDMWDVRLGEGAAFVPLLNRRALSGGVLVASLAAGAWAYARRRGGEEEAAAGRPLSFTLYVLAACVLALALLTADTSDYFEHRKMLAGLRPQDAHLPGRLENARQFAITALWTLYGSAALFFGVRRDLKAVRYGATALLAAVTIKVVSQDLAFYAAPWHTPLLNQTFAAFALVVAAYWFAHRLYLRAGAVDEDERTVVPVLVVVANVLALVALSAEASGHFRAGVPGAAAAGAGTAESSRDLELARQLSLSVIWATYGGALLVFGRVRRNRLLRLMALALLGLTTLKVFFWDLSSLDRAYRIISFIVLGAILLAVSYLYQKSQQQQRVAEAEAENA